MFLFYVKVKQQDDPTVEKGLLGSGKEVEEAGKGKWGKAGEGREDMIKA